MLIQKHIRQKAASDRILELNITQRSAATANDVAADAKA